jgi:hypothetical protein
VGPTRPGKDGSSKAQKKRNDSFKKQGKCKTNIGYYKEKKILSVVGTANILQDDLGTIFYTGCNTESVRWKSQQVVWDNLI